ncbi:MAG: hypothetical protein PHX92_01850 [Candidatus Pacebacteria bacterium]|nr:hypothetical protein [Candidatus Paceibacterota bacterium]
MNQLSKLFFGLVMGTFVPFAFIMSEIDYDLMCEKEGWRNYCNQNSELECQSLLNQCQTYFEEKRGEIDADLTKTNAEKNTLKNQINSLSQRIKDLDYQIYQSNLAIKSLDFQAKDTEKSISETEVEIENQKKKIALIIREVNEQNQKSLIEILITSKTISDFFDNLVYLETLNLKNKELLTHFQTLEANLKDKKIILEEEKGEKESLLSLQAIQKEASASAKSEKDSLYNLTEAQYQQQLKEKEVVEAKSAEIAKKLIQIVGLAEDQVAPTFGEALALAKTVAGSIGIRPSFLLAIISQESAIGRNVGQCYITNTQTGGGVYNNGKSLSRIIHPTRDLPIFLEIIKESGRVMEKTPVSCWIAQCATSYRGSYLYSSASVRDDGSIVCSKSGYVPFGFGGAMGPAQFIPSTWKLYENKVMAYTGKSYADPWNLTDSFAASAIYLKALGGGSTSGEYSAASRYYGGSSSYASQVKTRAWCIQEYIDKGQMTTACENLIF